MVCTYFIQSSRTFKIYIQLEETVDLNIQDLYELFYEDSPNVKIMQPGQVPDIKSITNTNNCNISVNNSNIPNQLVLIASIDNLVKGAAGQAVECYNLMNGFNQSTGIKNGWELHTFSFTDYGWCSE